MKRAILKIIFLCFFIRVCGCANQDPPPGGPDDKSPPVVLKIYPANETLNFRDNKITIEFDEYIERRSFMDAFFITPKPDSEIKFNFGGKDVEIEFPGGFKPNTTYNITITKDLRDVRGNNSLNEPIVIAFSTGSRIDKGSISGKVSPPSNDVVSIFCYNLRTHNPDSLDPSKIMPDYISQTGKEGAYIFSNLPSSEFRFFAIIDKDRNSLYDKDFEKIAVTYQDFTISDSSKVDGANFLIEDLLPVIGSREFLELLKPDSAQRVFSSIQNNQENIANVENFYFYFRNNTLTRFDIADKLTLKDTAGNTIRIIYNWYSDSLLQIIPAEPLRFNTIYRFNAVLGSYIYTLNFKTASESKTGKILGTINSKQEIASNVILNLIESSSRILIFKQSKLPDQKQFEFRAIPVGEYRLFAFIDTDNNDRFNYGSAFPFVPSERFVYYEPLLSVKPNWTIDNVFVNF